VSYGANKVRLLCRSFDIGLPIIQLPSQEFYLLSWKISEN